MIRASLPLILVAVAALALSACDDSDNKQEENEGAIIGYAAPGLEAPRRTLTGNYLAAHFAQSGYDWRRAETALSEVLAADSGNTELQRRAMALALGSEQFDKALQLARNIEKKDPEAPLPRIVLALELFRAGKYPETLKKIDGLKEDGVTLFIVPLLRAWSAAGLGKTEIDGLKKNESHLYQAILLADYRNDEETLKNIASRNLGTLAIPVASLERIAEIYLRHGMKAPATDVYTALRNGLQTRAGEFQEKIESLEKQTAETAKKEEKEEKDKKRQKDKGPVKSPQAAVAAALLEMGGVLSEHYEDSARLFTQMAQYLSPDMPETLALLAGMAARHEQFDAAIDYLQRIDAAGDTEEEIRVRRAIADLLDAAGKTEDAAQVLSDLVAKHKDVKTQIQIGDLYRQREDFQKALLAYNQAFEMLDGKVLKENWELLYARGMTYERMKKWDLAERDLKAAMGLQPDHPYLLNYLGYSWADQGIHLEEATRMIARAVSLRPDDGYIVDSLGWVHYRTGKYDKAVEVLERAAEILPNDPTVNDHLGDAYWRVGRRDEARFQWKRALSFEKGEEPRNALKNKIDVGLPDKRGPSARQIK